MSLAAYESGLCPNCGTHASKSHDPLVVRDVLRDEDICQDCKAMKQAREQYHDSRRHTDDTCDCADQHFFVAEYVGVAEAERRRAEARREAEERRRLQAT